MIHELKCPTAYFWDIHTGHKNFEVRKDDRGFKVGDALLLQEWFPKNGYSGRQLHRNIKYILSGGDFGIQNGYVVIGLEGNDPIAWNPKRPPYTTQPYFDYQKAWEKGSALLSKVAAREEKESANEFMESEQNNREWGMNKVMELNDKEIEGRMKQAAKLNLLTQAVDRFLAGEEPGGFERWIASARIQRNNIATEG